MDKNPWQVDSIHAFYFLKCPECIFNTNEEFTFQEHAIENHPLSFVLFQTDLIEYEVEQNIDSKDKLEFKEELFQTKQELSPSNENFDNCEDQIDFKHEFIDCSEIEEDVNRNLMTKIQSFYIWNLITKMRRKSFPVQSVRPNFVMLVN